MAKLKGKILNIILILIIGGLGGVLADQFLLPYLANVKPFSNIEFIRNSGEGTVIINPTKEIIVAENVAIEESIEKIRPALLVVQSYNGQNLYNQTTGFILTGDGLIITSADLISASSNRYLVYRNSHVKESEIVKIDLENNLALLKMDESNLPVVSLVEIKDLRLGQKVILAGSKLNKQNEIIRFVNLGIIRSIDGNSIELNFNEDEILANGSPLINIKGEVIGLNIVDNKGLKQTIPAEVISKFIGL